MAEAGRERKCLGSSSGRRTSGALACSPHTHPRRHHPTRGSWCERPPVRQYRTRRRRRVGAA
eukprot:1380925-Rhodomonas_salina.1